MKQKGRKVVPWFQTVSVISFSIIIMFGLLLLIFLEIINKGNFNIKGSEEIVLVVFIVLVVLLFIIIRSYYFNSNRHIEYLDNFNLLPVNKQMKYKYIVLTSFVLLPFLLLFVLYLFDKRT